MEPHSYLGYPDTEVTGNSVYRASLGGVSVEVLLLFVTFVATVTSRALFMAFTHQDVLDSDFSKLRAVPYPVPSR